MSNFLTKGKDPFLAVKKFSYSLKGGLAEHAEDFKRFKLELFISSLAVHPNVVRTYGTYLCVVCVVCVWCV